MKKDTMKTERKKMIRYTVTAKIESDVDFDVLLGKNAITEGIKNAIANSQYEWTGTVDVSVKKEIEK